MTGSYRGNGRGGKFTRKDTRKYQNGKQGKTDEIRRALTHRARTRKNYFKLLEREGMDVPERDVVHGSENEGNDKEDADSDTNEDMDPEEKRKPKSQIELIKTKVQNHEALTYQERMILKKDRREKDRKNKMEKTKEKLDTMKMKNLQRRRQTERLQNTKTRKGQPLMGPRINSLLEKIRQDK